MVNKLLFCQSSISKRLSHEASASAGKFDTSGPKIAVCGDSEHLTLP
jgi:hypothetical protein